MQLNLLPDNYLSFVVNLGLVLAKHLVQGETKVVGDTIFVDFIMRVARSI